MTTDDDHPTPDDTGKPVVDADGSQVGIVADVAGDTVAIDPDPGLTDELETLLGRDEAEERRSIRRTALHRDRSADLAVFRLEPDRDDD